MNDDKEVVHTQENVSLIAQVEEDGATRLPVLTAHEVALTVCPCGGHRPTFLMLSLQA